MSWSCPEDLRKETLVQLGKVVTTPVRSPEELLQELQVHQIELEMQNEALIEANIALEHSRDRFVDFYELAPVGYLTVTEKGLIADINLTGAALLGAERRTILQHRLSSFVVADDADRYYLYLFGALKTDEAATCELRLQCGDRAPVSVRLDSLRLVRDGQAPALRVVVTDITESKRADETSKDSHEALRSILETTRDGYWQVDEQGRLLDVNQAYCRLSGYSREELLGMQITDLEVDEDLAKALQHNKDIIANGNDQFETRHRRKDGSIWHVEVSATFNNSGKGMLFGFLRDISERKKAEEQLREMAVTLEQKVIKRTESLHALSTQLVLTEERERRELAQELHDNLGQLLALIRIKLGALASGSRDDSISQLVSLVKQADQSTRTITQQLSPSSLRRIGFIPAVESLVKEIGRSYGLEVRLERQTELRPLKEEIQIVLYRSIRELLINVAKHAKVSKANLSIQGNASQFMLVVSDSGCGFDPGTAVEDSLEKQSFGLSSIYEHIVGIGGEMDLDSSPGDGTTVILTLNYSIAAIGDPSS
jgi:PAS domain S-box-containing protein